jgi:hypothetical protein
MEKPLGYCRNCIVAPAEIKVNDVPLCERCVNDLIQDMKDVMENEGIAYLTDYGCGLRVVSQ